MVRDYVEFLSSCALGIITACICLLMIAFGFAGIVWVLKHTIL